MHDLDRIKTKRVLKLSRAQMVLFGLGTVLFSGVLFYVGFIVGGVQPSPSDVVTDVESDASVPDSMNEAENEIPSVVAAIGEVEFLIPDGPLPRPQLEHSVPAADSSVHSTPKVKKRPLPPEHRRRLETVAEVKSTSPHLDDPSKAQMATSTQKNVAMPSPGGVGAQPKLETVVARPNQVVPKVDALLNKTLPQAQKTEPIVVIQKAPAGASEQPHEDGKAHIEKSKSAKLSTAPKAIRSSPSKVSAKAKTSRKLPKYTGQGRARFTLQVKATKDANVADEFLSGLRKAGFYPHKILVETANKGTFYRIRVGRFETMEEARAFQRHYSETSGADEGGFITRL